MKNIFLLLSTALLVLFCLSCTSNGNDPDDSNNTNLSSSSGGKIYFADKRDRQGQLMLTDDAMLGAGTMSNGKVTIALPSNVPSRFLEKIDSVPAGVNVEPLGVEVWFYIDPLRLVSNGEHIGDVEYSKRTEDDIYTIIYMYFSEDTKLKGTEYNIEAKKGWNEILLYMNYNDETSYITTDLSEIPDGLKWLFW